MEVRRWDEVELQRVSDPDSPRSAEGPDRRSIDLLGGLVRGGAGATAAVDVVDGTKCSTGESIPPDKPADAAAEGVTGHRNTRGRAGQSEQAVLFGGGVHRGPG